MAKKLFNLRVWILIIFLIFSYMAINPRPWAEGVEIIKVEKGSLEEQQGMQAGESILKINDFEVKSLQDYREAIDDLDLKIKEIEVKTSNGKTLVYGITDSFGFKVNESVDVVEITNQELNLELGDKITTINGKSVVNDIGFDNAKKAIIPKKKISMMTDRGDYTYLSGREPEISVSLAKKSNIVKGLDLQGGTRVLLEPVSDEEITSQNINDLIDVLSNRLNVYGLADLRIRSAEDLDNNKFVLVEIAGASREEVRELIGEQGVFEAIIGEDIAFEGSEGDITFVCRDDGSCSGIRPPCSQLSAEEWSCAFEFQIRLSEEATKRHADLTGKLDIGEDGYLSKSLSLILDGKNVSDLRISSGLKGQLASTIVISGPGYGSTEAAAYEDALAEMKRLQTVMITGSLPFDLEIVKLDTISPALGSTFVRNSLVTGLVVLFGVIAVLYVKYRRLKVVVPIMITMLSEAWITLGIAALIGWNIDMAAIAGIIAAIGTGVDDQIVITDETLRKEGEGNYNWKEKLKRAFGIVFTAYATTVAAMLPLWNAGAGLVRGFAVTTILGVTIGILITRPAFASIIESLLGDE
jgi:preprotein translocase subunit SecD